MAKRGRLEAQNAQSSNWSISWTDSQGTGTATVTASNRYPTDLCSALQSAIQALAGAIGDNATVSLSRGESGTGRVTINTTDTPFSVTWTSTDLRDSLGFTANISSASSAQTGAQHARGLWLPDQVKWSPYGDSANGSHKSDFRATVGRNGTVHSLYGGAFRTHRGIRWAGISQARALANYEAIVNESFESFMLDCKTGRFSPITVNPNIRLIWDADVDGTYATGKLLWSDEFDLEQFVSGWAGRFNVMLPDLVVESA